MSRIGVFTITVNLGESFPGMDVCNKQQDRMVALAKLMFDNVETVEFKTVQPVPEPQEIHGYHVTGQVELTVDVNAYIEAPNVELARQQFIKSATKGLAVTVVNDQKLDLQDYADILVSTDIDVEEVNISE